MFPKMGCGLRHRRTGHDATLSQSACGYTGDGLRAWKQNDAGARKDYLYDGADPVAELDASGNLQAVNTFGASGLVSRHTAATNTSVFYTFDERGNLAQRLNAGGGVLSTDLYDAFGARTGTAAPSDPWGFGAQWGYQTDTETGLVLCTNRYYDPQQGRFLTRDPLGYAGGVNLYGYVGNNPANEIDPDGLAQGDPDWCEKKRKSIENIKKRIGRRIDQLHNDGDDPNNPCGLPETTPNDNVNGSESRRGHRRMINEDRKLLNDLEWLYHMYCGGGQPPIRPVPVRDVDSIHEDPILDDILLAIIGGGAFRSPVRVPVRVPVRIPIPVRVPVRIPVYGH